MPGAQKNTKERIFEAALVLFSEHSYHTISLRDIAHKVGIAAPSIYNHYGSKDELLQSIYDYFDGNMAALLPDLQALLAMVGSVHPHEILRRTVFVYPPETLENMARAMLVTTSMVRVDPKADELIFRNLVHTPYMYDPPLLGKMMEMDLIEPIDVDSFTLVHSCYCHSSAVRFYLLHKIENENWNAGHDMIFSTVRVKDEQRYGPQLGWPQ